MEPIKDPADPDTALPETDSRFPSGPWTGFFFQPGAPGKHWMELDLSFRAGRMTGAGRDRVGRFAMAGRYYLDTGKAHWVKTYLQQHSLDYSGYNEGKGIWGTWKFHSLNGGGFLIWPVAMGDPTQQKLAVAQPISAEDTRPEPDDADQPAYADPVPAGRELEPVGRSRLTLPSPLITAIRGR